MDEQILLRIYESLSKGETVAMAVINQEIGSAPRRKGSIMAIWQDGKILGSIGGGKVEYAVIEKAKLCIEKREDSNFEYKLNEQGTLGMQCGGEVKGFIKIFYPKTKLIIAGAGHIGEKLNKMGKILGFYTVILDDRKEYANKERFEDADEIIVGDVGESLTNYQLNENDNIVIVTKGHVEDKEALKAVVKKELAYIGMIGSQKKIKYIMNELIEYGIPKEDLQKVYAPMGLNISSNAPEEIALGILSEILLIRNKGTLNHRKDLKKVWD
jgi:xanthine dehydrogenase accessory factor